MASSPPGAPRHTFGVRAGWQRSQHAVSGRCACPYSAAAATTPAGLHGSDLGSRRRRGVPGLKHGRPELGPRTPPPPHPPVAGGRFQLPWCMPSAQVRRHRHSCCCCSACGPQHNWRQQRLQCRGDGMRRCGPGDRDLVAAAAMPRAPNGFRRLEQYECGGKGGPPDAGVSTAATAADDWGAAAGPAGGSRYAGLCRRGTGGAILRRRQS